VTFTAKISGGAFDGQVVSSVFSPHTNDTGGFIGWEGLDPNGVSETGYDQHSGSTSTVNGTLAHISLGNPTPLPPTWSMMLIGLAGMGWLLRRRAKQHPEMLATA
jgi:hypothetical protein